MSYSKTNPSLRHSPASQGASLRAKAAQAKAGAAFASKLARETRPASGRRGQADIPSDSSVAFEPRIAVPLVEGSPDPETIAPARGSRLGAHVGVRRPAVATFALVTWLLLFSEISAASAVRAQTLDSPNAGSKSPRRLFQYTGAVVAGSAPIRTSSPVSSHPSVGYTDTAYAPNPAVGALNSAMASGEAPSDIVSARARGWVRGKIMGQRIDASGVATAKIGHNQYGGVTGVAHAHGQFNTQGRYGQAGGQGQASAGVATTQAQTHDGHTVMHGAAAAQASGSIYGALPTGTRFYGRGSASAQAEGTLIYTNQPGGLG